MLLGLIRLDRLFARFLSKVYIRGFTFCDIRVLPSKESGVSFGVQNGPRAYRV